MAVREGLRHLNLQKLSWQLCGESELQSLQVGVEVERLSPSMHLVAQHQIYVAHLQQLIQDL